MTDQQRRLAAFNDRWQPCLDRYRQYAPPPWWAPGLQITPEVRGQYEVYVPVRRYLRELQPQLAGVLPHRSWLPLAVRDPHLPSLADLWAALPLQLAGRVAWAAADLLPLACALAAPRRHGTRAGRYPEQLAWLKQWRRPRQGGLLALDLGCGTGQGTGELAGVMAAGDEVVGVTREPLEAWMAKRQHLPHCPTLSPAFAFPPSPRATVNFVAADLRQLGLRRPADLVVCNGVIGGPDWYGSNERISESLARLLAPGGVLLIGSRFHDGYRESVERFLATASAHFQLAEEQPTTVLYRR